jgi:hypothetical protein
MNKNGGRNATSWKINITHLKIREFRNLQETHTAERNYGRLKIRFKKNYI